MDFLEIQFALQGKTLPADNGYPLYSALKTTVCDNKPFPPEVLISSINGIPDRDGMIYLNRASKFRLRCPTEQVNDWYRLLQSHVFDVQGHLIRLVQPRLCLPKSSEILKSRLVTFKLESVDHGELPYYFLESCKKAMDKLEIKGNVYVDSNVDGDLARRTVRIKKKHIVGFGVVVEGLSDEDSIKLQGQGLGGRKHFGCGWFYHTKGAEHAIEA